VRDIGDPLTASAADIARAVRARAISAVEVAEAYVARIAAVNPRLNAIVTHAADPVAAATAVDRSLASGADPGPLAGVPFTVKDSIATAGLRTTAGSALLADFIPAASASAVDRLERAGAVLLGKTNTPEFALELHTDNQLFGPTFNPRDPGVTPGGSSGGESAALAAGCTALGIATDFGASIRWPAQCTAVIGLRPGIGRVPLAGVLPFFASGAEALLDTHSFIAQTQVVGPMARTVADVWLGLVTMSGPDGLDVGVSPRAFGDPSTVRLEHLACAWFGGEGTYPVGDDVVDTVARAAQALAEQGMNVSPQRPPAIGRAEAVYDLLRTADNAAWMSRLPARADGTRSPAVHRAIEASRSIPPDEIEAAIAERSALRRDLAAFMERFPFLLAPVSSAPAFAVTHDGHAADPRHATEPGLVACCRAIGLFGLPSASVPCGVAADGRCISVQVVGRTFAEHEVVAVASALERHFGGLFAHVPARAAE
jgi:amidase